MIGAMKFLDIDADRHQNDMAAMVPTLACCLFLLIGAAIKLPYVAYNILRLCVFGVSAFWAFSSFIQRRPFPGTYFVASGIVFNPFMPIYLSRGTWKALDVCDALLLFAWVSYYGPKLYRHTGIPNTTNEN